jgi:hypothetical protein
MRKQGNSSLRGVLCVVTLSTTALLLPVLEKHVMTQAEATPDLVSRRVRLRGAGDPNFKPGGEINVRAKAPNGQSASDPPKPPGQQTLCSVTFDNRTNLIAKTYIDGQFAGTIRPFAELSTSIVTGAAMLYARAEYNDDSADAWGPVRINCRTKYLWRLAD